MSDASQPEMQSPGAPARETQAAGSQTPSRLRDDADFRRYWLARIASLTGSLITAVAMPVLIYRMTGSPFLSLPVRAAPRPERSRRSARKRNRGSPAFLANWL